MFAAASLGEGEDGGYFQFLANLNSYVDVDSLYGGPPYEPNLKNWLQKSPGFNLGQVHAPVRITVHNPHFLLEDWEWFSGLSDLHKPVDMVMFANGNHYLERPYEKLSIEESNVDWFEFWINGKEDSDPRKVEQYGRWRTLRALEQAK
jgi:hypothetical protein